MTKEEQSIKKFRNLKQKIIFYVMSVSILLTVLITAVMSFGSIRSTNKLQLDNIQVTTRIASQSISSNLHLLTERIYNISTDAELTDDSLSKKDKAAYLQDFEQEIERLTKEEDKMNKEIKRAQGMLSNPKFVDKAPADKVQAEKDKLEKYTQMLAQIQERLAALK